MGASIKIINAEYGIASCSKEDIRSISWKKPQTYTMKPEICTDRFNL